MTRGTCQQVVRPLVPSEFVYPQHWLATYSLILVPYTAPILPRPRHYSKRNTYQGRKEGRREGRVTPAGGGGPPGIDCCVLLVCVSVRVCVCVSVSCSFVSDCYMHVCVPVLCAVPESAAFTSVPACVYMYPCRVKVVSCQSSKRTIKVCKVRYFENRSLATAHSPTYWCPNILSAWPAAATTPAPIAIPKLAVRRRSPPVAQCSGAMGRRMCSSFRGG